ncbi:MAG: ATP-binding protein, partial [Acidobacteriota bacterium]|nr:ATP-binding protein [Acidobacteriota bacterium]
YNSGEPYFGYQARSMRDDDGDGFPEAEAFSDFVIQPIYDGAGVEGILLHAIDVTAQVIAERDMRRHAEELAESEERLRLALEAGRMGSWEWELATNKIAWSAPLERIHGLEPGTFGGTVADFEKVIHPADLDAVRAAIGGTIDTQAPLHLEHRIVWPSGETRWIEKRGTVLRDQFGHPLRIAGVTLDVTERRESEDALKRSLLSLQRLTKALERNNKELDQFAYVASHDLKAPLRGIANLSQWIEEEIGAGINDQAKEYMELLRGRIHRMEGLIEGILSYSRVGRTTHDVEDVDVGGLLEDLIELLAPPEGAEIEVQGDMPVLHTERLPLQQVFLNLINNGLKYAGGAKARIAITSLEAGTFHQFSVRDNGPGIAPEYHEKIWGIFQTLNARDKVEGTGIGLALVRKIVDQKGGRAWVESEAGKGATFHVLWPRNEDNE